MSEGLLNILIGALVAGVIALVTSLLVRRTGKEANDTDRFEAILQGQELRIKGLETEVKDLQDKRSADRAEISRLRQIVRAWYQQLVQWAGPPDPLPMPPDDDVEFLGITHPRR